MFHRVDCKIELALSFRVKHPEKLLSQYDRDELIQLINDALDDYAHLDHVELLDFDECEATTIKDGKEVETRKFE